MHYIKGNIKESIKVSLEEYFSRGKVPGYAEFSVISVAILTREGFSDSMIADYMNLQEREWWRVQLEFDRDWRYRPVVLWSHELEAIA